MDAGRCQNVAFALAPRRLVFHQATLTLWWVPETLQPKQMSPLGGPMCTSAGLLRASASGTTTALLPPHTADEETAIASILESKAPWNAPYRGRTVFRIEAPHTFVLQACNRSTDRG
eukprot:1723817-Pyramimonas_sp.AAC.1